MKRAEARVGRGDFQTPPDLAAQVLQFVRARGVVPGRILEPTCGTGAFVRAAYATWQAGVAEVVGFEINPAYDADLIALAAEHPTFRFDYLDAQTLEADQLPWSSSGPLLICGNLPWVTTDALSRLGAEYQQRIRDNPKGLRGLEAVTGAGAFDISERLALRFVQLAAREEAADIALLLKESVARRVLLFAQELIADAAIVKIDSRRWFGASVASCLLYLHVQKRVTASLAAVEYFRDFSTDRAEQWRLDGGVVRRAPSGRSPRPKSASPVVWRHGIKHDAAAIFEFTANPARRAFAQAENGVVFETASPYVYPLLTARSLQHEPRLAPAQKYLLVPQRKLGDRSIERDDHAVNERAYLASVRARLAQRRSSIYRDKPHYAIFGVGDYTFAPYKVAVAGFYLQPKFRFLGRIDGKPCVLGDTSYFVPCSHAVDAGILTTLGNAGGILTEIAELAFAGKRPITKRVLDALDFERAFARASREFLFAGVRRCMASWEGESLAAPRDDVIMERAATLLGGAAS